MANFTGYGFTINGILEVSDTGYSVASAGDVNGDGIDDIIIGAPTANIGEYGTGESYVVFGNAEGLGSSFDLFSLDGTNGFTFNAIALSGAMGHSVASAGDVNGDDIDDIIIGAPGADIDGESRSGQTYVIFGSNEGFDASFDLGDLDGTNGFTINGDSFNNQSGTSVASAGDVNGDGIDDIIIGAPNAYDDDRLYSGESYVVFGSDQAFDASFDLGDLNGTNGFTIKGSEGFQRLGGSVSSAGDVNGDGIDDIIIGAPSMSWVDDQFWVGQTHVIFGSLDGFDANIESNHLDGIQGFTLTGVRPGDFNGSSVSSAGDVNGDGIDDVVISANFLNQDLLIDSGEIYVVFGNEDGFESRLDLKTLDGNNGFTLAGFDFGGHQGLNVSSAGDVNGDGIDDIIIGGGNLGPFAEGEAYVVFGNEDGFESRLDLGNLDQANGITFTQVNGDSSGPISVSSAGDLNGDGIDDLIIGAPDVSNTEGADFSGKSYVVYGGSTLGQFDAADGEANGSIDLSLLPIENYEPIAMNDEIEFSGTESFLIDVLANDSDPDGDELSIVDYAAIGGTASIEDGQIRFTPDDDPQTDPSLTYTISDGSALSIASVDLAETPVEEEIEEEEETTEEGTDQEETTEEGTDQEETTEEGTDQEETTEEGTDQEETTEEGTDQEETTEEGTDQEETTEEVKSEEVIEAQEPIEEVAQEDDTVEEDVVEDDEEEIIDETPTPIFVEDIVASEDVDEEFYGSDGGDDDFAWEITMFFAALIVGAAAFMG